MRQREAEREAKEQEELGELGPLAKLGGGFATQKGQSPTNLMKSKLASMLRQSVNS
jgi:hypothetical protein